MADRHLTRTVQYWKLVDARDSRAIADIDWNDVLRRAHGSPITHRILNRELTGSVVSQDLRADWIGLVPPDAGVESVQTYHDDTLYGLTISTDKDHIPNQHDKTTGNQIPVTVQAGYAPVDNLFVWFLPFGNMFGVLMESVSATRASNFASWMTRVMHDQGTLPAPNLQLAAVPVIDTDRRELLKRAKALRSVTVAGEVSAGRDSAFQEMFLGPTLDGVYRLEVKVRPIKRQSGPVAYYHDTEELRTWFTETFGSLYGELTAARVQLDPEPGDDLPRDEINLIEQRLTRKRKILLGSGPAQAFVASSAIAEIVLAYIADHQELYRLRA